MPRLTIVIDNDVAAAIRKMIAPMDLKFPPEQAAAALMRDWLIAAGHLPKDDIEEDTPTAGVG